MSDDEILKYLNKYLNSMYDIMNTKTFRCSMFMLRYIYYNDMNAEKKYKELYRELNFEEQKQLCINVCCNLVENMKNKKDNKIHNKVKEKSKDVKK